MKRTLEVDPVNIINIDKLSEDIENEQLTTLIKENRDKINEIIEIIKKV